MTYRSIFVHVDDAEPCAPPARRRSPRRAGLSGAAPRHVSRAFGGRDALHVGDASGGGRAAPVARERRRPARRGGALPCRRRAGGRDVPRLARAGRQSAGGSVLHARYADLAVIGQPARDEPTEAFSAELAKAVIMGSGRPVLFVPYVGHFKTVGERIMIAWKDSRESARAVADALPLLKDAKKVFAVAITAGRRRKPARPARRRARRRLSCAGTRSTPSCGARRARHRRRASCCCRRPPISAPT